jgi:hypothetical protein
MELINYSMTSFDNSLTNSLVKMLYVVMSSAQSSDGNKTAGTRTKKWLKIPPYLFSWYEIYLIFQLFIVILTAKLKKRLDMAE